MTDARSRTHTKPASAKPAAAKPASAKPAAARPASAKPAAATTTSAKPASAKLTTAPSRPARRGAAPQRRRPAARPTAHAPRTPFVLLVVGLLGGALVSLLLLNTVLAEDAFRLHDLRSQNTRLQQREQELKQDVAKAEAPAEIARRARQLGGHPGPQTPAFISSGSGRTLGHAQPMPTGHRRTHGTASAEGGGGHDR